MVELKGLIPLFIAFGVAGMITSWSIQKEHPTAADIIKFVSIGWPSAASLIIAVKQTQSKV